MRTKVNWILSPCIAFLLLLLIIIVFVLIVSIFLFIVKKKNLLVLLMIQLLQVCGQRSFRGKGKGPVISSIKLGKREKLPGGFVVRWTSFPEKKMNKYKSI